MKKSRLLLLPVLLLLTIILLTGCADVPVVNQVSDSPYGFFGGLWHGLIIGFSFIGSIFSDDIALYAFDNSGFWYNLGFLIGSPASIFGIFKIFR